MNNIRGGRFLKVANQQPNFTNLFLSSLWSDLRIWNMRTLFDSTQSQESSNPAIRTEIRREEPEVKSDKGMPFK